MSTIKEVAAGLIRRYGTNNPFTLAEARKIPVLFEPLGATLGYFSTYKRIPIIHINQKLDEEWQRFVCSHELGHGIIHPKINTPFLRSNTLYPIDRIEREANEFAVHLLTGLDKPGPEDTLEQLFRRNGIPAEMIKYYRSP
ncbi:ImmA/IrrE family metallo-endopeptidase [Gorillibacterium timonense]|uniref:ImmA/IrrE family metallo-endopeptidase n=1 Tax=Gorillibacterium timonense TaxID=1689269 RepID=UPI00071D1214|nr:ImmA/IrrE family metallo-endopeptidase [Gorillibacterium timonense]